MTDVQRIGPETLSNIYKKWLQQCGLLEESYWSNDIHRATLAYGSPKEFDDYVWGCGGRIYQYHGQRYVEFSDNTDLTLFLLKWA